MNASLAEIERGPKKNPFDGHCVDESTRTDKYAIQFSANEGQGLRLEEANEYCCSWAVY